MELLCGECNRRVLIGGLVAEGNATIKFHPNRCKSCGGHTTYELQISQHGIRTTVHSMPKRSAIDIASDGAPR